MCCCEGRSFLPLLPSTLAFAQRSGDMRDPDLHYNEGWTTLFNGKDFGRMVVVLKGEDAL